MKNSLWYEGFPEVGHSTSSSTPCFMNNSWSVGRITRSVLTERRHGKSSSNSFGSRRHTTYQCVCLPFGLTLALWVFTNIMKPVVRKLRQMGNGYSADYIPRLSSLLAGISLIRHRALPSWSVPISQSRETLQVYNWPLSSPFLFYQEGLLHVVS